MTAHRIKRFIFFFVTILIGILIGIIIGWEVIPINRTTPGLNALRIDYQTDYVLMVAELYQAEDDLSLAEARLSYLGEESPQHYIQNALAYGEDHQYAPNDLALMGSLAADLQIGPQMEVE